jgi:hypothetical protein
MPCCPPTQSLTDWLRNASLCFLLSNWSLVAQGGTGEIWWGGVKPPPPPPPPAPISCGGCGSSVLSGTTFAEGEVLHQTVRKRPLLPLCMLKMIILPTRQARDKRKGSTQTADRFLAGVYARGVLRPLRRERQVHAVGVSQQGAGEYPADTCHLHSASALRKAQPGTTSGVMNSTAL